MPFVQIGTGIGIGHLCVRNDEGGGSLSYEKFYDFSVNGPSRRDYPCRAVFCRKCPKSPVEIGEYDVDIHQSYGERKKGVFISHVYGFIKPVGCDWDMNSLSELVDISWVDENAA